MKISKTIREVKELVSSARKDGKIVGLVPTMGALHVGHISLIETALKKCDFVVVSIFVNPTQFAPTEDFEKYPRPIEKDFEICKKLGVDVVFNPSIDEMYPAENLTWINVEKLTKNLCGKNRQGHFRGVATVCAKLFNIIGPDFAFFGQKDAQQAVIIKRMVADLNMNLEIVVCPLIRQKEGLAASSRNEYLTEQQKHDAAYIYRALQKCMEMVKAGTVESKILVGEMESVLSQKAEICIDYISIVDCESLEDIDRIEKRALIAIAAKIGNVRLIDNIVMDVSGK